MRPNKLILILTLLFGLILISSGQISAQSKENGAKTTPATANADLEDCSQMLDKSIEEKRACVDEKNKLEAENATLKADAAEAARREAAKDEKIRLLEKNRKSSCFGIGIGSFCLGIKTKN